jgi:pimeloyl-ACP methyl ester carboxylesterase
MAPEAQHSFSSRRIRVNGIDLNVVIEGEGPDVLLIHGFPDDHTVWRHQIPVLVAAGYRVIALDTRGCGASEMPRKVSDYRIDRLVDDLVDLLDALEIDKVRLVAHDWGAVQAWCFAIQHPERVDRYIALSVGHPASYARGGLAQKLKGYYILLIQLRGFIEFFVKRFDWLPFRAMFRYREEFPHVKARLERRGRLTAGMSYYRANIGMMLPRSYPPVMVPVVGIWSSGDIFLTERQMRNSGGYCSAGWRYERLDGANHWLQLTAAERLNALLVNNLR